MKIAVVTCYSHPDYIRAVTLRENLAKCPGIEVVVVKNKHTGILRYAEVVCKVIACRFRQSPDAFLLTFRGYEMLPAMLLLKGRKPLIFDELINAVEWLEEHRLLKPGSFVTKMCAGFYGFLLRRCRVIVADTDSHAKLSAELCKVNLRRYAAVPVGTDEKLFHPGLRRRKPSTQFEVFYYGSMLPLHGLEYVLEAAVQLPEVHFTLVGGKQKAKDATRAAIATGANITQIDWVKFQDLPQMTANSDLALGGPFGNTLQSQHVVTGKTYQFLACGVPVLIGKNLASAIFQDKKDSLIVPQADSKALADAITWAANHRPQLTAIGDEGRKTYEKYFSQKVIQRQLTDIIKIL